MAVIYISIWDHSEEHNSRQHMYLTFFQFYVKKHALFLRVALLSKNVWKLVLLVQLDGASLSQIGDTNTKYLCFCWWQKQY
jgi:hypothetical protein